MKRVFTFIGLLLIMAFAASAKYSSIGLNFRRKTPQGNPTHVERAPMHLPIDVSSKSSAMAKSTHRYTYATRTVQPSTTLPASTPH